MEIQPITPRSFAVYITSDDLTSRHLSPETLTAGDLRLLLGEIIPDGVQAEIELFPGKNDALVFVRKNGNAPVYYVVCLAPPVR